MRLAARSQFVSRAWRDCGCRCGASPYLVLGHAHLHPVWALPASLQGSRPGHHGSRRSTHTQAPRFAASAAWLAREPRSPPPTARSSPAAHTSNVNYPGASGGNRDLPACGAGCATIVSVSYDRSRELGDCCGFCLACGWGRRFMVGNAASLPEVCPDCGGKVITACPGCGEPIASLMALTCRSCGQELRPPVLFGGEIRRKPERHLRLDAAARGRDNESTAS